jgi:hypothetical protein
MIADSFFTVSSLQLSFETYLSVDIKGANLGTDGDIFKSRANQVYRTLTSRHMGSTIPESVGDQLLSTKFNFD